MSLLWSFYLSIKGSKKMSKKLRVLTQLLHLDFSSKC